MPIPIPQFSTDIPIPILRPISTKPPKPKLCVKNHSKIFKQNICIEASDFE